MCKDLIIVGAGGLARDVAWLTERINEKEPTWNILGFLDDNSGLWGQTPGGYPVLGGCDAAKDFSDAWFVCAIGSASVRKKIISKLGDVKFATLIDPSVIMSNRVKIGRGTTVCASTIITVDVSIGSHVVINSDCTVGHDAAIEDFVTLYPGANVSGMTRLGSCVEMGTGSQIIQGKTIGKGTIVGAGAVVVKDIPQNCVAVGSPAKPIKFIEE